jgi:hypothetical protein
MGRLLYLSLVVSWIFCQSAFGAERLINITFETETWQNILDMHSSSASLNGCAAIVDEATDFGSYPAMTCHDGDKCMRLQLKNGVTDPITGKAGNSNQTGEFLGSLTQNIADITGEVYISWWGRFDKFNQGGDPGPCSKYFLSLSRKLCIRWCDVR